MKMNISDAHRRRKNMKVFKRVVFCVLVCFPAAGDSVLSSAVGINSDFSHWRVDLLNSVLLFQPRTFQFHNSTLVHGYFSVYIHTMSLCTVFLTCEPAFRARCSCENWDFECKYTLAGRGWDSPRRHIPVSLCPNRQRSSACTWTRARFLLHHSGWRGGVVHLPISCRTPKWKVNEVYHLRAETCCLVKPEVGVLHRLQIWELRFDGWNFWKLSNSPAGEPVFLLVRSRELMNCTVF